VSPLDSIRIRLKKSLNNSADYTKPVNNNNPAKRNAFGALNGNSCRVTYIPAQQHRKTAAFYLRRNLDSSA
jgi:hypothetical protein